MARNIFYRKIALFIYTSLGFVVFPEDAMTLVTDVCIDFEMFDFIHFMIYMVSFMVCMVFASLVCAYTFVLSSTYITLTPFFSARYVTPRRCLCS